MLPTVKGVGGKKRRGKGKSELDVEGKKTKLKEMHGSWPRRLTCKEVALSFGACAIVFEVGRMQVVVPEEPRRGVAHTYIWMGRDESNC